MEYRFMNYTPLKDGERIFEIDRVPNKFERFFGAKTKRQAYSFDGDSWQDSNGRMPSGKLLKALNIFYKDSLSMDKKRKLVGISKV